MTELLEPGDVVLLIDGKGRRFLVTLSEEGTFDYHLGSISHARLIGSPEGEMVETAAGGRLRVTRPRLADYILKMQRGAQVVYPKDIGPILVWADIGPGMTVLEAGTGSGALTAALARAVGDTGRVISVERREDHAKHARKTLRRWFGDVPDHVELITDEVESVIPEVQADRIVLDLPEPWYAARLAADSQDPGTIVCCYLPTVPQVQTLVEAMAATRAYLRPEVTETLYRSWNVAGRSVRPDHQMVGHTGFLVVARRVAPDAERE